MAGVVREVNDEVPAMIPPSLPLRLTRVDGRLSDVALEREAMCVGRSAVEIPFSDLIVAVM